MPVVPFVLVLTTFALVLAQFRVMNKLRGSRLPGLFGIYIFLAVIGAYCDVSALIQDGKLAVVLFGMILLLVIIHAIILYGIGGLFRQDWDMVSIASQANVGGATSALALVRSLNRPDLQRTRRAGGYAGQRHRYVSGDSGSGGAAVNSGKNRECSITVPSTDLCRPELLRL